MNRPLVLIALLGCTLLVGCVRGRPVYDRTEESIRVQTMTHIHTSTPGADVRVNGKHVGATPADGKPLTVKLIYRYQDNVFKKEKSYLFYREAVESRVKEWLKNRFEIAVSKPGYHPAETTIDLKGEHEYDVRITLRPREGLLPDPVEPDSDEPTIDDASADDDG